MFTGIVSCVGQVKSITNTKQGKKLQIACTDWDLSDVRLGDSIAVNGVCLTVTNYGADFFAADVSHTTLQVSALGNLQVASYVNLEKALRLNDRLGGHLVAGHVDCVGVIAKAIKQSEFYEFTINAPSEFAKYLVTKGSITVDGVSLTIGKVQNSAFDLTIIKHTLSNTIIANYQVGYKVNLEVDLIARYLEGLLKQSSSIDQTLLQQHGFI